MKNAVDNPILNNPFEEPIRYWSFDEGQPKIIEGRRPAGFYLRPRTDRGGDQTALFEEEFLELKLVNEIRKRVQKWKNDGYPGVTRITLELLRHWQNPERERKLFFCQIEAAETIIFLIEAPHTYKQGISVELDKPDDQKSIGKKYKALTRYALKMATGSGKTIVMAMLISWSVLNKFYYKQDKRFSDAVLIVCPNLTINKRLQVLFPSNPDNYYQNFEIVPQHLMSNLGHGKFLITNWHAFLPVDDSKKKSVVKRGPESDNTFCNRVLTDIESKENILIINDEAHHAYRPKQNNGNSLNKEDEEQEEATIWVGGLDKINAVRGINFCIDLSATPFYLAGSGHPEGSPFSWIVSDFGLVDAIESGIVKIPRIPVDDNSGMPIPKYFKLWETIMKALPASERAGGKRKAKPESVLREAEDALATLASEWKNTSASFKESGYQFPPVMILVSDNTDISELLYEHIAKKGNLLKEFINKENDEVTLRIDTKLLNKAESQIVGLTRQQTSEFLREKLATVGKVKWEKEGDPPGKDIRCVIAVGMINEGWDAQNVTQIFGLRAFTSQLLCEQVVGRGLRRTQYDDFSVPEYVDVYGVPFEVIPVKKASLRHSANLLKPSTLVKSLEDRKHLEIKFPRVEGYVYDIKYKIKADINKIPELHIDPSKAPTEVIVKEASGYRQGRPDRLGPGKEVFHTREQFYKEKRFQSIVYDLAASITNNLKPDKIDTKAKNVIFPQVLEIVRNYVDKKVVFAGVEKEELALRKYFDIIVERLSGAIEPDISSGEQPILPILERFRQEGSTSETLFRTTKTCHGTTKSHISHVVTDTRSWEHTLAYELEKLQNSMLISYARNDRLGFTIPYQYEGRTHPYTPDFIVKIRKKDGSELNVIVEVKGFESEKDRAKEAGARRWVKAVNYYGKSGMWELVVCKNPRNIRQQLENLL